MDLQGTPETRFFQTIAEDIYQELGPILDDLRPGIDESGESSHGRADGNFQTTLLETAR